jgi:hypothetical protein
VSTHPKSMTDMTRRGFFAGAVSAAFAARVALALPASAQAAASAVREPVNIATATDSNMFQRWRWWFDLAPKHDGSFTLTGIQVPLEEGDEDGELYEMEPVEGLRTGEDIHDALRAAYDHAFCCIEDTDIDGAVGRLSEIDPSLAEGFIHAVEIYYEEMGG